MGASQFDFFAGGPMFNLDGEVVGIVSHILTLSGGSQGLGFAVSAKAAQEVLQEGRSLLVRPGRERGHGGTRRAAQRAASGGRSAGSGYRDRVSG